MVDDIYLMCKYFVFAPESNLTELKICTCWVKSQSEDVLTFYWQITFCFCVVVVVGFFFQTLLQILILTCLYTWALRGFDFSGLLSHGPLFSSLTCKERPSEGISKEGNVSAIWYLTHLTGHWSSMYPKQSSQNQSLSPTQIFFCCFFVCFCFVNVQWHKTSSSPHVSFLCMCPCRVKVVWLSFNRLTTGSLRLNSAQLNSLSWKSWQSRSFAEEALIHPVEALRILNGNVKFFPQLLERFIWRQIQAIEAVKSNIDIIKSIDE